MDHRILVIAPIAALVLSAGAAAPRMPAGWLAADHAMLANPAPPQPGSRMPQGYEVGIDPRPDPSGLSSLSVRSVAALSTETPSIGAARQEAWGYAGSRVRLSGQVRAEGASTWAGLYVAAGGGEVLSNLTLGKPGIEQRLPRGAAVTPGTGWQDLSVVFDVPADAPVIDLGLALVGAGQAWVRALRFEVVGPQVPVTATPIGFDWAGARAHFAKNRQFTATFAPMPLANAALD